MNRRELLAASAGALSVLPTLARAHMGEPLQPASVFDALLSISPPRDGRDNQRWAEVKRGVVAGSLLRGVVRSGRLDWHVDPASGAVSLSLTCNILGDDGATIVLRDRTAETSPGALDGLPGLRTAPLLFNAMGVTIAAGASLAGCLEADVARGIVRLRAFGHAGSMHTLTTFEGRR